MLRLSEAAVMNKRTAAQYLPLVAALAEGRTIQANRGTPGEPHWVSLDENDGEVRFSCEPDLYRVEPDSTARNEEGRR
jgi:hypothetical protein